MLPYDAVVEPSLLADLAGRGVELVVAVTPPTVGAAPRLVDACRAAGVGIGLWPMLDDRDGRWPSAANAELFARFCRELLAGLRAAGSMPDEIAIDLEPPIHRVRALLDGRARALMQAPGPRGGQVLAGLVDELRAEVRVSAAVTPVVMLPSALASRGWERALGTPLDLGLDSVNAMAYTSLFEGYSRGWLRRDDAVALLSAVAAACARRWGARAAISLGVVGAGALGDENAYRNADELAEDVALAEAAGIDEIALFALDGIVARPPREAWLDALQGRAGARAVPGRTTWRTMTALVAGTATGIVAGAFARMRRRPR
jgi:hypothetical protein